ncbi:MAG: ATP-binding protein [bacterium]|nr:ATP-binding protein [bacterium]
MTASTDTSYNLRTLVLGLVSAAAGAALISAILGTPPDRLLFLIGLMFGTGALSLWIGYRLYLRGAIRLLHGLHLSLLVNIVLIFVILFVNVSAIAFTMILAESDTVLITSLLIFAAFVAILLGILHSRVLTAEVQRIIRALDHLGDDPDFDTRLPLFGNDELAALAQSFNKMAAKLREADLKKQQMEQIRRDLVAWVSHDLRTPLTSLRIMNEALMDGMITDPQQAALYAADMNREIIALGQLIDDMFELALFDAGQFTLNVQKASLRDLLSSMVGGVSARAARHNIRFSMEMHDPAIDPVWMATDKIQRVLNNLVDNAFQYTDSGGEIRVAARSDAGDVVVHVHNSGAVIPQTEVAHIFDLFYRGDKARRDTTGHPRHAGLGLAIARRFIEAHGGTIWAHSEPEHGTTIYFRLPRMAAPSSTG